MKGRIKGFIIGIICGVFVASGVGYATDQFQLDVKLPHIPYIYDGKELNLTDDQSATEQEELMPQTINYKNINYVSVRALVEAMGKEVSWDEDKAQVLINSVEEIDFEVIDLEEAEKDIEAWVSVSLGKADTKKRSFADQTHVLITLGEKNSGGYDIHVTDVKQYYNKIVVHYDVVEPEKGTPVINAFTYPYEVVALPQEYKVPFYYVQNEPDKD